jgi:hypothetical protein
MFVHAFVQFLKRIWVPPQDPSSTDGGYWSLVPVQVSENDPLPVDISRSNSLIDESSGRPHLLVRVGNNLSNPLFIKPINIDILFLTTTTVTTTTNRDLWENTNTETPTLDNCGQYRKLVWFYFRAGASETTYRILARATDLSAQPLGTGWQQIATGTLPGNANSWGRIEIPSTGDGYYDQYRIEVWRTNNNENNYTLTSKLIGVRG